MFVWFLEKGEAKFILDMEGVGAIVLKP